MHAKTGAERQAALRQRRIEQQLAEVRGLYAHADDHEAIKAAAAKIMRKREKAALYQARGA